MGAALDSFIKELNDTSNFNFDTATVTIWVRRAESVINNRLRSKEQVKSAEVLVSDGAATIPSDAREIEHVRVVSGDWLENSPLHHLNDGVHSANYSVSGGQIFVGTPYYNASGASLSLRYFADVPPLDNTDTALSTNYRWLLLAAVMGYASIHMVEDERAGLFSASVNDGIDSINEAYRILKGSGSPIRRTPKRAGF